MANKIHIKLGPIEFEAEGDSDLIQREREQFFSLLPQAIVAVSPVVPQSSQLLEAKPLEEGLTAPVPGRTDDVLISPLQPQNIEYESLAGFLNDKQFSTGVEIVMGVAYYIELIDKSGVFTSKDVEKALDESRKDKPNNIPQMIVQNIKKGFLRECKEKKDGLKTYCVLDRGKVWCESYTPTLTDEKKKPSRAKTKKATVDSPLLAISLDELNLDKYCDISQISKFNEQMIVLMLIYTKEKEIEYFSFNDIVSVFKNKFKLPATDRKVRYAFDNGGTMFDKKVEKKIAYHKLMSGGIKEAERIVSEQRAELSKESNTI